MSDSELTRWSFQCSLLELLSCRVSPPFPQPKFPFHKSKPHPKPSSKRFENASLETRFNHLWGGVHNPSSPGLNNCIWSWSFRTQSQSRKSRPSFPNLTPVARGAAWCCPTPFRTQSLSTPPSTNSRDRSPSKTIVKTCRKRVVSDMF